MDTSKNLYGFLTGEHPLALLRLHRAAFGREPLRGELAAMQNAGRDGQTLPQIASTLLDTDEARSRHGDPEAPADAGFVRACLDGVSGGVTAPEALALEPFLIGDDRAACLATLAGTRLFLHDAPPLPALFADKRPDNAEAYAFWRSTCEQPPTTAPVKRNLRIVMPVGDTTIEAAGCSIASLLAQTHQDWTLVMVGHIVSSWSLQTLRNLMADDRVVFRKISDQNASLADAVSTSPDLVCLIAPGDLFATAALPAALVPFEDSSVNLVYTDEDQVDARHGRALPRFKPLPCLDALLAGNALGQLSVFRASVVAQLGGLLAASAPYALYDLILKVWNYSPTGVFHLPTILFHAAGPPGDWPVPASHPRGSPDIAVVAAEWPRIVPLSTERPLVSVIIPTRDRPALLEAVTRGVLEQTDYTPLELLIVDHNSIDPSAIDQLARLAADARVRVISFGEAFNFATMNNRAAAVAQGKVLLLLNNDIQIREPKWLSEMVGHALRPDVGLVGARLLDRDGRLQHGGIAIGPEGRATHLFRGAHPDDPGYLGLLAITREVSAVTGACMALRRTVWEQVGGMNEAFPVTWNDVDLCQRIRAAGLRIIWTPHAVLTHLEGETRGIDAADPARLAAFVADRARYRAIWGKAADIDPFINPNLQATDYELCLGPSYRHPPDSQR